MKKTSLHIIQEILWVLMGLIIATVVVWPLYQKLEFVFLIENFLLVFYAWLLFRMTIFFHGVAWLKPMWMRFIFFLLNVNLFVFIILKEQQFIDVFESFSIDDLGKTKTPLTQSQIEKLYHYFYFEINLTVVASLILIVMFIGRLVHSYWSVRKMRLFDDRLD